MLNDDSGPANNNHTGVCPQLEQKVGIDFLVDIRQALESGELTYDDLSSLCSEETIERVLSPCMGMLMRGYD